MFSLMRNFHAPQQKVEARWATDLRARGFVASSCVSIDRMDGNSRLSVEGLLTPCGLGGIAFRVGVVSG
jgi:hypothetical protein